MKYHFSNRSPLRYRMEGLASTLQKKQDSRLICNYSLARSIYMTILSLSKLEISITLYIYTVMIFCVCFFASVLCLQHPVLFILCYFIYCHSLTRYFLESAMNLLWTTCPILLIHLRGIGRVSHYADLHFFEDIL
jgi:hypothetical protein